MTRGGLHLEDLLARVHLVRLAGGPAETDPRLDGVVVVQSVPDVRIAPPRSVVVVAGDAAAHGWSVDAIIRLAWERAAACVIVPHRPERNAPSAALAERLGVRLLGAEADVVTVALQIAGVLSAANSTDQLLAATATRLAAPDMTPVGIAGVLQEALPGYAIAVKDGDGVLLVGDERPDAPAVGSRSAVHSPRGRQDEGPREFRARVAPAETHAALLLIARERPRRAALPGEIVEHLLELAAAPLSHWLVRQRVGALLRRREASAALERFLDEPADPAARVALAALGMPMAEVLTIAAIVPRPGEDPEAISARIERGWLDRDHGPAPVRHDDAWVCWWTEQRDGAEPLLRTLDAVDVRDACTVGLSGPHADIAELDQGIDRAVAAARFAARDHRAEGIAHVDAIGDRATLLAGVPDDARQLALQRLEPLLRADADGSLLRTLLLALEVGERPNDLAARLGVHRNTVSARLARIRELDIGFGDPAATLSLHLAAAIAVGERERGDDRER